jgi:OOP family OmpA-OmpF porin
MGVVMLKVVGGVILIAAIGGFVLWGASERAAGVQAAISERAQSVAENAVHGVQAEVSGRDIRISGLADTEAERDALLGALNEIEGARVVTDELKILPLAKPYVMAATRKGGQTLLQGNVPTEDLRAVFASSGASGVEGLTLVSGAPERWEKAIGAGLKALSQMDEGSVSLNGTTLRLTGLVEEPSERDALLASVALPDGFAFESDIETRDDGLLVAYEIAFDVARGVTVTGTLPDGLDVDQIGKALGGLKALGDAVTVQKGDPEVALAALSALKPWLPQLGNLTFAMNEDGPSLTGVVAPNVDAARLSDQMKATLAEGTTLSLSAPTRLPEDGARRVNAITGKQEQFQFGAWMQGFDFAPTLSNCAAQTERFLASVKINFASGVADFDASSAPAVSGLAVIMDRCIRGANLVAEIAGHTDNTGNGNFERSANRALFVRAAVVNRGVPANAVSAIGYGGSKPIADNGTEAGRAANRRVTVRWGQR